MSDGTITPLRSTDDVFIPPRGNEFMKFSFGFPEPSVEFAGYRFGFLVFSDENTYGLHLESMEAVPVEGGLELRCSRFTWAGGQETAPGSLTVSFRKDGDTIEWDVVAMMDRPVKTVTTVIRGIPRGKVSLGAGGARDRGEDEILAGYPFAAGDLHGPGAAEGITTPVVAIEAAGGKVTAVSPLDRQVRPKRFYLQPGPDGYRIEAIYEHEAWRNDHRVAVPRWRLVRAGSLEEALAPHMAFLERTFQLVPWEDRSDMPAWTRDLSLAVTLHGMHYTGFMFNDYARMGELLRWIGERIPPARVLVFLPAWDGRYYYDYPTYRAAERMGGEAGFQRLVSEARRLGFHVAPMFGLNAANRRLPSWAQLQGGAVAKLDGDVYNLNWVDWNNDRHQDGWLAYMNVGEDSWREHLLARIDDTLTRYGADAYFLDISAGHVNARNGDMHLGTRRLVEALRRRHPDALCIGEFPYDALHGFIPLFQVGLGQRWRKYSRNYSHLSSPAPGRGSSGVHEQGFGRWDASTLNIYPGTIPTLQVVEDTFTEHRGEMEQVIREAVGGR